MAEHSLGSVRRLKYAIRGTQQWLHRVGGSTPSSELFFQSMFNNAIRASQTDAVFYPVGSAANYSLLYVVHRILTETDVTSGLDVGAGQTSILFNLVRPKLNRTVALVTLESDANWAERIQARVDHRVKLAALVSRDVFGHQCRTYAEWPAGQFDLVIVDGPNKTRRRSRWGVLELLDRQLGDQFIVVFDDATRAGELDTIATFLRMNKGVAGYRFVHAGKSQCVIFSEKYAWLETLC